MGLASKKPTAKTLQRRIYRRAWRCFMSRYHGWRGGSTGVGYYGKIITALVAVIALVRRLVVAYTDQMLVEMILISIVLVVALSWCLDSVRCVVVLHQRASVFAKDATREIENPEEVNQYFNQVYPWMSP